PHTRNVRREARFGGSPSFWELVRAVPGVARQAPEDLVHQIRILGERLDSRRPFGIAGSFQRSGDPPLPLLAGQPWEQQLPKPLEIVGILVPHLRRMLAGGVTLNNLSSREPWP